MIGTFGAMCRSMSTRATTTSSTPMPPAPALGNKIVRARGLLLLVTRTCRCPGARAGVGQAAGPASAPRCNKACLGDNRLARWSFSSCLGRLVRPGCSGARGCPESPAEASRRLVRLLLDWSS